MFSSCSKITSDNLAAFIFKDINQSPNLGVLPTAETISKLEY
ncbi:hypothetical protein PCIT_a2126 [Pseudoalteromonas citrea]|uniref:Uncharacterized protein n=1 Tax=Pseudoalteromonas citrea TaxID=43655 RepID=A0AAD4FSD6_9GAMM|nr:hypothetical protein PCIT_a2126 [Pseudoalteromonas citrea]